MGGIIKEDLKCKGKYYKKYITKNIKIKRRKR